MSYKCVYEVCAVMHILLCVITTTKIHVDEHAEILHLSLLHYVPSNGVLVVKRTMRSILLVISAHV